MSRARKHPKPAPKRRDTWGNWSLAEKAGSSLMDALGTAPTTGGDELMFTNDLFTVLVAEVRSDNFPPPVLHLSFRYKDRRAAHDWRHIQRLKNELCGADVEATEIYPAEKYLMDGANQYHLWALPPGLVLPWGDRAGRSVYSQREFRERLAAEGHDPALADGTKQREEGLEELRATSNARGIVKDFFPEWAKFSEQLDEEKP